MFVAKKEGKKKKTKELGSLRSKLIKVKFWDFFNSYSLEFVGQFTLISFALLLGVNTFCLKRKGSVVG